MDVQMIVCSTLESIDDEKSLFSLFHGKYVKSQMLCYAKHTYAAQRVRCDIVNSYIFNYKMFVLLYGSCTYTVCTVSI